MNIYIIAAIISSILFGVVTIMQKKAAGIDSVTFTMFSMGSGFLAIFLVWLLVPNKVITLNGATYSMAAGILSAAAFLLFILALRMCKVSTVVIINSFNAVVAVILAVTLLHEKLTATQILGVIFGLSGVALVTI